jgi:hypothetical protein
LRKEVVMKNEVWTCSVMKIVFHVSMLGCNIFVLNSDSHNV